MDSKSKFQLDEKYSLIDVICSHSGERSHSGEFTVVFYSFPSIQTLEGMMNS
jgi:hypothetical protein